MGSHSERLQRNKSAFRQPRPVERCTEGQEFNTKFKHLLEPQPSNRLAEFS